MKAFGNKTGFGLFAGLCSLFMVLCGVAALFCFFPELPEASQANQPFIPRVRYRSAIIPRPQDGSGELRAILSPSLIALPNGVIHPVFGKNHVNQVTPPIDAFHHLASFAERPLKSEKEKIGRKEDFAHMLRSGVAGPRMFSPHVPFAKPLGDDEKNIRTMLSGGLQNASIEGLSFSSEERQPPDMPWAATLYARFNSEGIPVAVLLESPSPDNELNKQLVRKVRQSRLASSDGAKEGCITFWRH